MLISCFTPTHNPRHLAETYRSLQLQQGVDWEWVVVPNGRAIGQLPAELDADPRVRVHPYRHRSDEVPSVGHLKRFACDNAKGDVFAELDHDDLLMPGVLGKVAGRVQAGAGFVYSDAAVFIDDKDYVMPLGYSEQYGWETYEIRIYGRDMLATRAFDAEPRALCEVYYAPDHIRCWTRDAYYSSGGHNPELIVGDDHDLICRTYLQGFNFAHTGGCGYIYRTHEGNTVKSHNEEIQRQQARNRDTYFYRLLDEWNRRQGHGYLDMAGRRSEAVIEADGTLSIKHPDNSLGVIRCFDFLQFIPSDKVVQAMEEIHRVLTPGGFVCIAAPSTDGRAAFAPNFKSFWNEESFQYYCDWQAASKIGIERPVARFQQVRCWTAAPGRAESRRGVKYVYADLCALKGQRQPGLVRI